MREDVVLAEHEIDSTHKLTVEVRLDRAPIATMEFEVTVALIVRGVVAEVRDGLLTAIRCGDVVAGATVSLWGQDLADRKANWVVGALISVGAGIPLVPGARRPDPGTRPIVHAR
jgi:hypothetical protein